ncbi:alpha/beta hydrolase [Limnohabitans sp.]|jgi:pimeloyl-ACP methyl ester carboxylesterase|uniref:alpha/beta hydrolase n=1 Tax=Limnohabitans sp. TaxID=1907725 RepID=UPI00286F1F0B|nr:alpha/beta hydrolase [Limnohabitans sp.]
MQDSFRRVLCMVCLVLCAAQPAWAADRLIPLTTRPEVTISYWWMPRDGATATVLLFAGGGGGIGYRDGEPKSGNFLMRSRDEFAKAGFNVALMGNPSDAPKMTPAFRQSAEHLTDVRAVVQSLRERSQVPVWLVGTSQGTLSAAAAGMDLGTSIAGVVLTSTVTGHQFGGSVSELALDKLLVPVLVHQHAKDGCKITPPYLAERLMPKLTASPVKKYMEVDGGQNPTGPPCEAFHHHGYIGMESEAVAQISAWIKHPVP